jgi:multidrug efflux pump subunit AcrA (membrane-fusion protein)
MRKPIHIFCLSALVAGCGGGDKNERDAGHSGLPAVSVTSWTKKTELFMEYRSLVAGKQASFAAHVTDLKDSKPITRGKLTLVFSRRGQPDVTFSADGPTTPGIFRPIAEFPAPGDYTLSVKVDAPGLGDTHALGRAVVHADEAAARASAGEDASGAGAISFLKEQQWQTEFAVEEVRARALSERIATQASVRAPMGRAAAVLAPASGVVVSESGGVPLIGASVRKGQALVRIRLADGSETPVIAPSDGVVGLAQAAPNDRVEAGWKLFDLLDLSTVWIEARVYEQDLPRLSKVSEAIIELPGSDERVATRRVVSEGGSLDAASRTMPVVFEAANPGGRMRIGASVTAWIATRNRVSAPAVPISALVDEDGTMVAYVQTGGESFERRRLNLGIRDGGFVEVKEGLQIGERMVTMGAYKVRLAAASSQIPAHGHAH